MKSIDEGVGAVPTQEKKEKMTQEEKKRVKNFL